MKNKFLTLLLPVMMMGSLIGCSNGSEYNDFCAQAADAAPLLLNSSNGKEIFASETTVRELANYNSVLALNSFIYLEKELTVTWDLLPAEKWVSSPYVLDASRNKISPVYGKEGFEASIKATVSYIENGKSKGKTELNWKFNVASTDTVELTLKEINENFVNNGKKITGMDKDEEGKDINIGTRGIITGSFEAPDHVYAGVFISNGEYSMQLYSGSLSDLWKENQLKVGDCVFAVGTLHVYNGYMELYPSLLEQIDANAYNIAAPTNIDASSKSWNVSLLVNASSLITLSDCIYDSGNITANTAHASINFKHGDTSVTVYCNYHLGPTMMDAIKGLVEGYTAGTSKVTLKGILSFYNDTPQIIPIFGADSFVLVA